MRSTLFHIPQAIPWGAGELPLFGVGLLTGLWLVAAAIWLAWLTRRQGLRAAAAQLWLPLVVVTATLGWVLPLLDDGGGIPVRGYGVMLLAAAVAGTWLSIVRARRIGVDAETILALATEVFIWGIVGARLFYVIEYHEQFFAAGKPLARSLFDVVNIAAGGLVVFGSLPTAAIAAWRFARRRGIEILELADVIAPGLLVGLAIGRLGCFLNGCCYGGPCDLPWAVSFPAGTEVAAKFPLDPSAAGSPSTPVHPTQLYAAIDAGLLALLAVAFTPLARRAGEVFALVLTLHPISRMLLEEIRVDEPAALGTPLSISALVSLALLGLAAGLWWWIARQPVRGGSFAGPPAAGDPQL
jgi:phosphatidylglycerol---prolipoprotein diacylglyceryl transferase